MQLPTGATEHILQIQDNPKKWDLSKHFLFETANDETINLVYFHSEDEKELLIIKKALASLFSVKVQLSTNKEWKYNTTENDHYGEMKHEYNAAKTSSGMTLRRHHYSTERGQQRHEKVLHYDHRGTLLTATAHDSVILKEEQPYYKERQPEPGEFVHRIDTSGDFPAIHMSAQVHVKLEGKKYHRNPLETFDGLTPGTLQTEETKEIKRMSEVNADIQNNTECIRNISDATNVKRLSCVQNLRLILQSLHEADYHNHVEFILNRTCDSQDIKCLNIRLVYIDLVARAGDVTSQEIILKDVLDIPEPVEDELRRVFIHCIVIMRPTESALALFESAIYERDKSIRKMALEQYRKHPKSKEFTRAHGDVILSQTYNYPSLVRYKRSLLDKVLLNFDLRIPRVEWNKVIGSEAIGASFGVKFDNRLRAFFHQD
ncbi:uncharacterized protein LOC121368685 [Gigantopelta aegis]|uniref:uncharacterized protein LOC121368685 n=1 Tax=Gigantopelta aegis TaxID=1735272 RepID=UPI001B88CB5D|nr:uncharacterized protein LOC121368685 [Gigantopelta aegis]